jgi:predicted PurR-regulated permease PerM
MRRDLTPLSLASSLLAVAAVVWIVPQLLGVLFTLGLSVVFALLLDSPVAWLCRRGLARGAATALVVVALLGTVTAAALLIGPELSSQFAELSARHGDLIQLAADRINELAARLPFPVPEVDRDWVVSSSAALVTSGDAAWLWSVGSGLAYTVVALVMSVWVVSNPDQIAERLLRFVPPERRDRLRQLCGAVERRLRRWVLGQMTVMAAVGAGSYLVFKLLGVPFAELFALVAMLMEAVPTIGVLLAALGPVLMLLVDDPSKLLWLIIGITVVQQLEDRLLVPVVIGRAVQLPAAMLLLALLAAGVVFGIGGMVLAAPVLAVVITVHDELTADRETR